MQNAARDIAAPRHPDEPERGVAEIPVGKINDGAQKIVLRRNTVARRALTVAGHVDIDPHPVVAADKCGFHHVNHIAVIQRRAVQHQDGFALSDDLVV